MEREELLTQKLKELEVAFQQAIEILEDKCRSVEIEGKTFYECDFETAMVIIPLAVFDYIKSQLEFLQPDITISVLEIKPKAPFWRGDEDTAMLLFAPQTKKFLLLPYEF